MNKIAFSVMVSAAMAAMVSSAKPWIVAEAEAREAHRQNTTWTSENIQANPYLFLQDQIKACDMMLEIDEDPTKLTLDDLTAEDPNTKRNQRVKDFLSK